MFKIEAERSQLIDTWKATFADKWISDPKAPVRALVDPAKTSFHMSLRHGHNLFGWKAGDTVRQRGLCSGAIYRTERFMDIEQDARCGSKGPEKNVHIEHTVPIAELNRQWVAYLRSHRATIAHAYAWMLCHSVSTAFHIDEMGGIKGHEGKTEAFNPMSSWFNRPFMRYTVKDAVPVIWNVLSRQRIDPQTWTFADHFEQIDRLFDLAGCAPSEARLVKREAARMIMDLEMADVVMRAA
ncbi:hypothetical protein HFN89_05980 [Rhizobium laguerreae]|nr:hypothetical protein [Rhizobium laguerreae]